MLNEAAVAAAFGFPPQFVFCPFFPSIIVSPAAGRMMRPPHQPKETRYAEDVGADDRGHGSLGSGHWGHTYAIDSLPAQTTPFVHSVGVTPMTLAMGWKLLLWA